MAGEVQGPPAAPASGPNWLLWAAVGAAVWYLFLRRKG